MSDLTLTQFVNRYHVTMTAEWADANPHMNDPVPGSSHWKCRLRVGRRSLTVYFSMGPALNGEPTVQDVLDCLASDAVGYENARSFEDWASEYGYHPDSRKAERTYRAVERQANGLKRLLGAEVYGVLLWKTERL